MRRPRRATRPSAPPERTSALVGDVFRWLNLDDTARGYRAMRAFSHVVGPRIRSNARAEKLCGATLYVRVKSSAWSQQLHVLKEAVLKKVRATPGGEGVGDLRFTVGDLDELPDWDRPLAPAAPPVEEAPVEPAPLADELRRAVAEVADPELRDELNRLYAQLSRSRP